MHTAWAGFYQPTRECAGKHQQRVKRMYGQTPEQWIGLVRASPQGQLQGIVGNCASILEQ